LASVANNPSLTNFETNTFGVEEVASALTGAPLMKPNS